MKENDSKLFDSVMSTIHYEFLHNTDKFETKLVNDDNEQTQYIYYSDEDDFFAIAQKRLNTTGYEPHWELPLRDIFGNTVDTIYFIKGTFFDNYFNDMWNILSGEDERINDLIKESGLDKEEKKECEEETDNDNSLDHILNEIDRNIDEQEKRFKSCCHETCDNTCSSKQPPKEEKEDNAISVKIREFLDSDDE